MNIPSKVNVDTGPKSSGAGAEITALAESLQAYACAARQHYGKPLGDISQVTEKVVGDANCDRPLKKCLASLDQNWFRSIVRSSYGRRVRKIHS